MTIQEIKKALKPLVIKDVGSALKKFESILNSDSTYYNDAILQQASLNGLKRDKSQGTISEAFANQRQAQIRHALLEMIDMLDEDDVDLSKADTVFAAKNTPEPENNDLPFDENSKIYISYAWKGAKAETADLEVIVDLLDKELSEKGIDIIRDKKDLKYKGSIKDFMEDIGRGSKVIVVLSKKYLESDYCMYELNKVYKNDNFAARIFPIVLDDAGIYDPINVIGYINYWDEKIAKLNEAIKSVGIGANISQLQQRLNDYVSIRSTFDDIAYILQDMNALSPDIHHNEDFQTLYNALIS